jgi:hypothetical protein
MSSMRLISDSGAPSNTGEAKKTRAESFSAKRRTFSASSAWIVFL